jgi:hypothetical protein
MILSREYGVSIFLLAGCMTISPALGLGTMAYALLGKSDEILSRDYPMLRQQTVGRRMADCDGSSSDSSD